MNKTLKIVGIFFLVLIFGGFVKRIFQDRKSTDQFEVQIQRANNKCPIIIANGIGKIASITFDKKNVIYNCEYKPGFFDINAYRKNPSMLREMMYYSFCCTDGQNGHGSLLADELIKKGYGVKFVFSDGIDTIEVELTPDYIKEMQNKATLNSSEGLYHILSNKIEAENVNLPQQIEEGMTMTEVKLENNDIVIVIVLDEDLYDISVFESISNEYGKEMLDEANSGDPETCALFDLCKISNSGLRYRMVGNQSGQFHDVYISSDQIRQHKKTPSQLNIR